MKLLQFNLREILAIIITGTLLLFGLGMLGSSDVAANGPLSTLVSMAVSVIGGVLRFVVCLALAWFGLAVTFPEAHAFIVSDEFDGFWIRTPNHYKGYVALLAVGILVIVAALCMAA